MPSEPSKPSSSSFEGDFAPGQILIGRYRIIALVGEGGMGQVYLADDLVLGQPVAVKFLPQHLAQRGEGLERFRDEVRHAREVSHPNVARVHDIGEVDGKHFLTMEFVDGEDLASLIKRIGRLPREKAAQIAQQTCSALSEAHRKGVLHRDLKPANVMLDGDGHVKLTDFGLAVAAGTDADAGALVGTPQYMAPEQLSGVPATVQSEVYSLGLLLYELNTGKRALKGRTLDELRREHEEGGPDAPSTYLEDIDPDFDAVVARCLARDPAERPRSVREVARALPGGDPLAAAVAAGETPAPQIVAAAGSHEGLAPRVAGMLVAGAAALILLVALGQSWLLGQRGHSYGKPAAYLREQARELATELTGETFEHEIHWYQYDVDLDAARAGEATDEAADGPADELPGPFVHHSRFALEPIVPRDVDVSPTDPAPAPGSAHLVLDAEGRLVLWSRRLAETAELPADAAPPNWSALLEAAELDPAALTPATPRAVPQVFATDRAAWKLASDDVRVEAASVGGRPVQFGFATEAGWLGMYSLTSSQSGPPIFFQLAILALAATFAWRNVRGGRADVSGSIWIGLYAFATHIVLAFGRPMPNSLTGLGGAFLESTIYAVHLGVLVMSLYLALEPFARRRWPKTLISWSRLLQGGMRDAVVGREILIGLLAAPAVLLLGAGLQFGLESLGIPSIPLVQRPSLGLEGPLQSLSHVIHISGDAIMIGGIQLFLLVLLRSTIRIPWLAGAVWFVGLAALLSTFSPLGPALVSLAAVLTLLTRVGFLSTVTLMFVHSTLVSAPLTLGPGDWYFGSSVVVLGMLAAVGGWAYRAAVVRG